MNGAMVYLKSQLNGFADTIADPTQQAEFRQFVGQIPFDAEGVCGGASLDALVGTRLGGLAAEFHEKHLQFLTPEAFEKLATGKTGEES